MQPGRHILRGSYWLLLHLDIQVSRKAESMCAKYVLQGKFTFLTLRHLAFEFP